MLCKVLEKKRAATTCPELVLYIDSARLHRERRHLVTHEDMEMQNKIRLSRSFRRLTALTRDDNLNIRREVSYLTRWLAKMHLSQLFPLQARRNLANLVGEAESHEIAGTHPPAHVMERDNVSQLRPPGGMGYNVEKLIEVGYHRR